MRRALAALILAALAAPAGAFQDRPLPPSDGIRLTRVVDGDTLDMGGIKIRLHGIDAPELDQTCSDAEARQYPCGKLAAAFLEKLIGDYPVICGSGPKDHRGRLIRKCTADRRDLSAEMVQRGWAIAYRRYSTDYVEQEDEARKARRGLWAGIFLHPEEWRQARR